MKRFNKNNKPSSVCEESSFLGPGKEQEEDALALEIAKKAHALEVRSPKEN